MLSHDEAVALAELAQDLQRAKGKLATADTIIARVLEMVPDADWVSLTTKARRGTYQTLASTSEQATRLDQLQYELDEGPCVDAADGAQWYRSGDVGTDSRWPTWGPRAREAGVGSLLSVKLHRADSTSLGAINLYSLHEGRFTDRDEVELAVLVGIHAAVALTSSLEAGNLRSALASRHAIGLAQGLLMERYQLDAENSFALLRRYSNTLNIKIADLAQSIIATGALPVASDARPAAVRPQADDLAQLPPRD